MYWISPISEAIFGCVVQEKYCRENNSLLNQLKEQGLGRLSGDGSCDSPRHNAKYLTYTFMDQITNKIAAMTITQVTKLLTIWRR